MRRKGAREEREQERERERERERESDTHTHTKEQRKPAYAIASVCKRHCTYRPSNRVLRQTGGVNLKGAWPARCIERWPVEGTNVAAPVAARSDAVHPLVRGSWVPAKLRARGEEEAAAVVANCRPLPRRQEVREAEELEHVSPALLDECVGTAALVPKVEAAHHLAVDDERRVVGVGAHAAQPLLEVGVVVDDAFLQEDRLIRQVVIVLRDELYMHTGLVGEIW